jgi:succinate dehydrogenase hydrophobic anchor subunit
MKLDPLDMLMAVITAICISFLVSLLMALPVMWIWNSTFPDLFRFPEISWWTAWKISVLCSFLFKTSISTKSDNS